MQSFIWPGRIFFGEPFTIPGPDASPQEQLQHDVNIAVAFNEDFEVYVYEPEGRARHIPNSVAPLIDRVIGLMYAMEDNLKIALEDMIGDEPTTDVGREEQAASFSDFRTRHARLMHGFVDAYNTVLNLVKWDHIFFHMYRSIRLYRDTLERYMILHAPRFLYNLACREKDKASHRMARNNTGLELDDARREQHDEGSEDDFDDIL